MRSSKVPAVLVVALVCSFGGECPQDVPSPESNTPAATLILVDDPTGIVIDAGRSWGYAGDGRQVRRFDLTTRAFAPPLVPGGSFYTADAEETMIGQINPDTGRITRIIPYPPDGPLTGLPSGMTFNPANGMLYVLEISAPAATSTLYEVDPLTSRRSRIGEPGLNSAMGLAFSLARNPNTGMLYTVNVTDTLWRIDPVAGTAIEVSGVPIGFTNIQALSFSPDGVLFGHHLTNAPNPLLRINLSTGIATQIGTLPLTYAIAQLAFKPDGTLWSIDAPREALVEIDRNTGAILREFPTLKLSRPSTVGFFFDGTSALTYAVPAGGDASVPGDRPIDSLGVDADGGVLTAAGNVINGFEADLALKGASVDTGGLHTFRSVVVHSETNLAYVRDGLAGKVYEVRPATVELVREIQYRQPTSFHSPPRDPGMGIDPQTNRLFVAGDSHLYLVDLAGGTAQDMMFDGLVEAVIVDAQRRRLHVNVLLGTTFPNGENCSSIRTLDLDTLVTLGEVCVGVQIFSMAFDAQRNRIATNSRFAVPTFDTQVSLFDMEASSQLPFSVILDSEENGVETTNSFDARLTIDAQRNQLLIGLSGSNPRVEFYELP